jgi:hypothetical protein
MLDGLEGPGEFGQDDATVEIRIKTKPRNTNRSGRLSTADLLVKIALVVKKKAIHFQYEKQLIWTSSYKEINRTDPSPSVRIPC